MKSNQKPVPNGVARRLILFSGCRDGIHPLQLSGQNYSMGSSQHKGGQGCCSDRPGQAGEMGRQEPHVVKKEANTKSCIWDRITPCSSAGWGLTGKKAVMEKTIWAPGSQQAKY